MGHERALEDHLAMNGFVGNGDIGDSRVLVNFDEAGGTQIEAPWTGDGGAGGDAPFADPTSNSVFETDQEANDQLLQEADYGPDGQPLDEMDAKFKYHVMQERLRDEQSPLVNIMPASIRVAQRGGSSTVTSGGPAVQVVAWQGEEGEVFSLVIAFSAPATLPVADGKSYRPYADITWGSDSNSNTMRVDISRGQQVTVTGGSLYVSVGMDAAPPGETAGTAIYGASFGLFSGRGPAPAQRTAYIDALANAATVKNILVPAYAVSLLPPQVVDTVPNLTLNFKDANNVVRYSLLLQTPGQFVAPVPISGAIYSIDVINNSVTASTNIDLVFRLSA